MTVIDEDRLVALTADDAFLIRRSFDRLWAKKQFATAFYDRLFELAPETRLLFHGDLRQQRSKLMTMVSAIVGMLDQPEMFRSTVASLTLRHATYGVQLRQYEPFRAALFWSLAQSLGPAFTPETEKAWRTLYSMLHPTAAKV